MTKEQEKRLRRRLSNCEEAGIPIPTRYRLRLTETCGTRYCMTPRLSVGGYVRLQAGVNCLGLRGACQAFIGSPP